MPKRLIRKVVYDNPLAFFRQSKRWQEFVNPAAQVNGTNGAVLKPQAVKV